MPAIRVPLVQGAYQARSIISAAQRCLNLYPERGPEGETSPTTIYQTPGLSRFGVAPEANVVRGLYTATNGEVFAAIGSNIYYIAQSATATLLGAITSGSTPVKMGDNGTTLVIVDGSTSGWTVDLTSHVYASISDPSFYGSNFVEEMDTFLIFNKPGTAIFYTSDSNAVTFDPLYFAAKTGYSDLLGGIAVRNRNLWLIGSQATSELWLNVGAADFPFQIMNGPFIEHGTAATYSIAKFGPSVFWLATDQTGASYVLQGSDLKASKVSTPAIEWEISQYAVTSDAVGWCYEQQGHGFYWLKFPTEGKDWVYDLTTQLWHERSWLNPATCEQESHRAFCHTYAYGLNICGDRENGQLYYFDLNNPTDNGAFIERRRGWPHMMTDGERVSYPSFVADVQAGTANATTGTGVPSGFVSPTLYPSMFPVISTTFTAPNGTLLQDYFIPYGINDVGSQYTKLNGTTDAEVQSNRLTADAGTGTAVYQASGKATSADYVIQFQAVPDAYNVPADVGTEVYVIGRADALGNGYRAVVEGGSGYSLSLEVMGGGATTTLLMGVITSGCYQVYLSMIGDQIEVAAQRTDTNEWLVSAGVWQADFVAAISITDSAYGIAGNVLVGGAW